MKKVLADLKIGKKAKVVSVEGERRLKRRLADMGVTEGTEIVVVKKAPLGDPIEVCLRGYKLSLRKEQASLIAMEV